MHFSNLKVLSRLNAQGILSLGILSISCGTVAFDSVQPVLKEQTLKQSTAPAEWRVMPVRTKGEFDEGKLGGEGEQHPHSIARCLNHPEYIYFSQDVAGIWRSKDNGDTWEKALDKGLWVNMGQSIEVDPVDPQTVFLISDNDWNFLGEKYQGLYRSSNGGDNWDYILPVKTNYSVNHHRIYRHNIAYDPSTLTEAGAQRWYVAFPASQPVQQSNNSGLNRPEKFPLSKIEAMQIYGGGSYRPDPEENKNFLVSQAADDGGLYRSEDMGVTWTSTPVSSLPGHTTIYAIQTHPTDGQTVYLASNLGLFISDARGENFRPLGNLPAQHHVSSIAINPQNPQIIYVTLFEEQAAPWGGIMKVGKGLYRSQDGGETFSELKEYDAARVFMNPGHPEVLYLSGNIYYSNGSIVSHDGGVTWEGMVVNPTPGLGREWKTSLLGELTGIVANPNNPNEAVAYSHATLWKTTDGGQTFNESATRFTGFAWAWYNTAVAFDSFDPQRLAFFNLDVGMTITTTGTDYFVRRNYQAWEWYNTCVLNEGHGGEIKEIPCSEQGAIRKILWMGTNSGSFQPIADSQIIVASIGRYFQTSLMRSEDNGSTWELVEKPKVGERYYDIFEKNEFIAFHPQAPNIVYAGNKISDDAGQTFVDIDFGSLGPAKILGMCLSQPDTVYAMDDYMLKILRSDDRGQTWRLYSQPGWQFKKLDSIPTFTVDPVNPDRIYSIDENGDLAILNGEGQEWHSTGVLALAGGIEVGNFVRTIAIDPNHPEIIYAGMFASGIPGIWRSVDGGDSWEDISNNLPRTGQHTMAVNPHTGSLFTGSIVGTWVFPPPYESDTFIYDKLEH